MQYNHYGVQLFVVEAIDVMLGGRQELRDIGEHSGYDRAFLGVETIEGEQITLERSILVRRIFQARVNPPLL